MDIFFPSSLATSFCTTKIDRFYNNFMARFAILLFAQGKRCEAEPQLSSLGDDIVCHLGHFPTGQNPSEEIELVRIVDCPWVLCRRATSPIN